MKRSTAQERRENRQATQAQDNTRQRPTRTNADQRRESGWNGELHKFTVQKPYCTPCRSHVYTALQPFGVPIFDYEERTENISIMHMAEVWKIELRTFENLKYGPIGLTFLPMAQAASFSVPANRARWVYYLLRSSGRVAVTGGKRSEWDNDARGAKLPTAWDKRAGVQAAMAAEMKVLVPPGENKAWIESSCTDGNEMWKMVQKVRDDAKEKGGKK